MRHRALARPQPRRLIHPQQADVEPQLVVDQPQVHDARHAVAELPDVAAEEHGQARAEHRHARGLERCHGHVDVGDAAAADDVAEAVDGEEREGWVARVVHEGHEVGDGRAADAEWARGRPDVGREGEGRGADLLRGAGLVGELPGELFGCGGGRAEGEGEDGVDFFHHFVFGGGDGGGGCRGRGKEAAEEEGVFAELGEDDGVDDGGGLGVEGVWVEDLGDEAVFFDEVVDHVPLAAVGERGLDEGLDQAGVEVEVGGVDDLLEEVVCFFEFVPGYGVNVDSSHARK